jgi:hypothetical protein
MTVATALRSDKYPKCGGGPAQCFATGVSSEVFRHREVIE